MTPKEIARLIKECYEELPADETHSGASEMSDAAIMNNRSTRLKIARECVLAGLGIDRKTGERT